MPSPIPRGSSTSCRPGTGRCSPCRGHLRSYSIGSRRRRAADDVQRSSLSIPAARGARFAEMSVDAIPKLRIAVIDMDAFYVSIELRRHPELKGKPVIVAGSGPRAVVTTASYEARRFGVGSAMPAARARRLCPEAVVLPPDFPTYREVSRRVMDLVRAHVERVEVVGLDEAYLDLTGLYSPRAAMRRLVAEIQERTQIVCSVGIGPNKLVAKVASDAEKPAGFVVLTCEQACARFAGHPPGLVPGIGP